MIDKIIKLQRT